MPEITVGRSNAGQRYTCANCDEVIQNGRFFYRFMIAIHKKSGSTYYSSLGRLVDAYVCGDCASLALSAIQRVPVTRRWRERKQE